MSNLIFIIFSFIKDIKYKCPGPLDNLLMPNIMDKKVIKSIESAV